MPEYNEQISYHRPEIHDTYTWATFKEMLKNGEVGEENGGYDHDKIYFIKDVDTQAELLDRLLSELSTATATLRALLR